MILDLKVEVHPGEGDSDAEAFAAQFAAAISVQFGRHVEVAGRLRVLDRL